MSTFALISDIHANLEALRAVFTDIDGQPGIEAVYCLGDLVGYGPDPESVIDLVDARCDLTILGNHDFALLNAPIGFNPVAAGAILCQRSFMDPGIYAVPLKQHRWNLLRTLPEEQWLGDDLLVHASPRDKIFEYILPEDTQYNPGKLEAVFQMVKRRCFVGHTHRPGVITDSLHFFSDKDAQMEYHFRPDEKVVVNVSSVGQPRDRDPRACYAIVSDESVRWRRVEYDIETTVRKVHECSCLDPICGERLRAGR